MSSQASQFEALWQEAREMLYLKALGLTKDHNNAEDLVAETSVIAWESFSQWRREARFSTWAYSILTFVWLSQRRRRRTITLSYLTEEFSEAESWARLNVDIPTTTVYRAWVEELEQLISELPQDRQEVIRLRCMGYEPQEIARITGVHYATVKTWLHRAKKLREKLAEKEW